MGALVLIAEADPFDLRLLCDLCGSCGYGVVTAADSDSVLDAVARDRPDLLLLDVRLPGSGAFEVIRILKDDPHLSAIPVLLMTGHEEAQARARGMEAGADDYLTRPFRVFEVQHRIRSTLKLVATRTARLESLAPPMDIFDRLTGTGTHSQLHLSLEYEYTRAVRYGHALSCLSVCVHDLAAQPLPLTALNEPDPVVELAEGLRRSIRVVDHLFRSGPDEFAILLPETASDGAAVVLRRIQQAAADRSLFRNMRDPLPELGLGCISYPNPDIEGATQLLELARRQARGG